MKNEKRNESQPMLLPLASARWEGSPAPVEEAFVGSDHIPEHPFPIAGFRHYDGAANFRALSPGTRLTLRVEPTNPHDAFAVEILHGPAKLGYVPRFCSRHVNRLLLDSVPLACDVERFDPQAPPWEAVAVRMHTLQPSKTALNAADRKPVFSCKSGMGSATDLLNSNKGVKEPENLIKTSI